MKLFNQNTTRILYISIVFIFIILACAIPSVKDDELKYDKNFNSVRVYLGIPQIERDWVNRERNSNSSFYWMNETGKLIDMQPHHFYKVTELNEGRIFKEKDAFHYEYQKYLSYRLIIEFLFDSDSLINKSDYKLVTYHTNKYPPTSSKVLNPDQVDSLLEVWKLDYRLPIR